MREIYPDNAKEKVIVEQDLSLLYDYSRLTATVGDIVSAYGTADNAFNMLGRHGLVGHCKDISPETYRCLAAMKGELTDGSGAILLRNTGIERLDDESAQFLAIIVSGVYGTPTRTDRRQERIAWPVRYDPDANMRRTFSQDLGEAAFHTDTQYFAEPEDYFGLFCIKADTDGKGTSQLLNVGDILAKLVANHGQAILEPLTKPFPFRVPSVFTVSGQDSDIEITWAPILNEEGSAIRYRRDTISAALTVLGDVVEPAQLKALAALEEVLSELKPVSHHLRPGEALLVNNTTLVHARTAFEDPSRFLYRVRTKED